MLIQINFLILVKMMVLALVLIKLFLSGSSEFDENVIIFDEDKSPSAYIANKKKDILILGKHLRDGQIDTLDDLGINET